MDVIPKNNDDQAKLWNGHAGRAWVEAQATTDQMLAPFRELLVEAVTAGGTLREVLDVGCGTGSTTVAVAQRIGAGGRCTGIDISEAMIAAARARTAREHAPARFIRADAQVHAFEPASFDMIISRFGVMFFDDPVIAFANLRRAAAENAALRFVAWRSPAENLFMTTAERSAAPLLPDLPARQPDAPGQFAFANRQRVEAILAESGWSGVDVRPIDVSCTLPERDLIPYVTRFGLVGRALEEADEGTRARVIEAVRPAFDAYVHGVDVRFTAACWMVAASRD